MGHGGPKRARSWKRRTEPRKAYRSWRSPLLGEHFRLPVARVHVSPDAAEHPPLLDGEQSGRQGLERKTAFHVTPRAPGAKASVAAGQRRRTLILSF